MQGVDLSSPSVMGILNVTPDSFSDGGRFNSLDAALVQAKRMMEEGASIIDVGGESTRPGAAKVSEAEELDRVIPVVEAIRSELPVQVSVDTVKPSVMTAAIQAGASLINDVNAFREPGAIEAVASSDVQICLMHMQGTPENMQDAPTYGSVVSDVKEFLINRCKVCERSGIARERIIIDPGFGFGKTVKQNYTLFAALDQFRASGYPVLVGVSRKSMIGAVLDVPPVERVTASAVLAAMAIERGAKIIRAHDVKETCDALAMANAVLQLKFNQD